MEVNKSSWKNSLMCMQDSRWSVNNFVMADDYETFVFFFKGVRIAVLPLQSWAFFPVE